MLGIFPTPGLSTESKWCMASAIYDVKNGIRWRKIKQEDGLKAILNEFKKLSTKDLDMTPQATRDRREREERKANRIKRWEDECSKEIEPDLDQVRILFTDGSRLNGNGMSKSKSKVCKNNNNQYYAGYAAISMDGLVEIKRPLFGHIQSNMRAEFKAIIEGLQRIKETDCGIKKILVYSDCLGVVHACNGGIEKRILKGWGKTKNIDLLMELKEILWDFKERIEVKHLYAHTKAKGWRAFWNDKVDELAKEGARMNYELDNGCDKGALTTQYKATNEYEGIARERWSTCKKCLSPKCMCLCGIEFDFIKSNNMCSNTLRSLSSELSTRCLRSANNRAHLGSYRLSGIT
jgi:ribonuclease HI